MSDIESCWIRVDWDWSRRSVRGLSALLQPVALTAHLEDVAVVGQPVEQSTGEPLRSKQLSPLFERRLVVTMTEPLSYRWLKTSESSSALVLDRGTKPSTQMISSLRREILFRKLSSLFSSVGVPVEVVVSRNVV